jgi:hypothetical protein
VPSTLRFRPPLAEQKTAEPRTALAEADAQAAAARERVAAIERGDDLPGGPFDGIIAALKRSGLSDADIEHVRETTEVYRLLAGDDEVSADIVMRKLAAESVAAMRRFDRKLVRRLLLDLRAAYDADETA